jgi:hypothetical protein
VTDTAARKPRARYVEGPVRVRSDHGDAVVELVTGSQPYLWIGRQVGDDVLFVGSRPGRPRCRQEEQKVTDSAATRWRKKPVVIDAMPWDGTVAEATPVIDWILANGGTARYHEADLDFEPKVPPCIKIDTLEGTMHADPGDWIIRGVKGEFYPCKPDIFETTYEPVRGLS